jgi:hypothetical protein
MSHQGAQNKNQTREQIEKQDHRNDIELGSEFQNRKAKRKAAGK